MNLSRDAEQLFDSDAGTPETGELLVCPHGRPTVLSIDEATLTRNLNYRLW